MLLEMIQHVHLWGNDFLFCNIRGAQCLTHSSEIQQSRQIQIFLLLLMLAAKADQN